MKSGATFELWLFYHDLPFAIEALKAGITGMIIDWETRDKVERQNGYDTQINDYTEADLVTLRRQCGHPILCRINGVHDHTADEIEKAVGGGADEILIPMVRTEKEVDFVLNCVRGRCGVGILIETCAALEILESLAGLPLSRVYVGLNDLRIDRNRSGLSTPNLFTPIVDGTIDCIRHSIKGPFGFAGLTVPDRGSPIPCRLLMSEMVRLQCSFSFLRRSFMADVALAAVSEAVGQIHLALERFAHAEKSELEKNRIQIRSIIEEISHGTTGSEDSAHVFSGH